jgi:tetratricopeptide (TPR) repeat protein
MQFYSFLEKKISEMVTSLNKITYLESAVREVGFNYEIKRFLWKLLGKYYSESGMYEKAARAISQKASAEVSFKDRIESYLEAGELYAKIGKVGDADEMFVRAIRDAPEEKKSSIKLARKNIYLVSAKALENKGKKASAIKFYEKLIKMNLDGVERDEIKKKLLATYNSLGLFREAKLLSGL